MMVEWLLPVGGCSPVRGASIGVRPISDADKLSSFESGRQVSDLFHFPTKAMN